MRLTRIPLYLLEDHVINLKFFLNAYVENNGSYNSDYGIRYFMDAAVPTENGDGSVGDFIKFKTKKAAQEALAALVIAADTMMIEEDVE